MKPVLVFGKHGKLSKVLQKLQVNYIFLSRIECDVTKREEVVRALVHYEPAVVINCAAQTDMNECERDPVGCHKINTEAVKIIAAACSEKGIYLLHISSDYALHPVNEYGKSKKEAERFAVVAGAALRVNFYTEESFVIKNIIASKPIEAYTNQFFNPISIYSFAKLLIEAAEHFVDTGDRQYEGVINIGVQERMSVYDFALLVCDVFEKDSTLVTPAEHDGTGLPRPADTYINPLNTLSGREDLEDFRAITQK